MAKEEEKEINIVLRNQECAGVVKEQAEEFLTTAQIVSSSFGFTMLCTKKENEKGVS